VSVQRREPLGEPVLELARELKRCEAKVALLDRVRPLNFATELPRLSAAFRRGERLAPSFAYAPRAALGDLRGKLDELATALGGAGAVEQQLLGERAQELALEAALAEQVGEPEFARLAARRFALPSESHDVAQLAQRFLTAPHGAHPQKEDDPTHLSDDPRDPESLWSQLAQRLGEARLPVRLELVPGLVSLAAVADGVVRLRPGVRLSARQAQRIALHEVEGHVRARVAGAALGGAFLAGSAGGSTDEEGRAILLEERAGLLDAERRRELGRRYVAAASVRQGADFWQTVDELGLAGSDMDDAIALSARVHRGGGLARELVYLKGYWRVACGLAKRPELEQLLCAGRISLSAAQALCDSGSVELDDDGNVV